ncbi:hypothetical protein AQJ30_24555 [Streptomyces longwoodensis]|uniref:Secreted protein n=1 Tax=Streptomyces longwoodensis TaxID=68231 RepID=A0A101QTH1_9ACTN|nr:hypothetical protein [Streptomyces longwoodensis]KUN35835.1 hypothetical protein AQJ30_24555 [Streptomyces longwoodensis]
MSSLSSRLGTLRGPVEPKPHNARSLAALTANPGCRRRAILDAAGVDKEALAVHLGHPLPPTQSPRALSRGAQFEAQVKDQGGAELLSLLRDKLHLPLPEAAHTDLSVLGTSDRAMNVRHARTRSLILEAAHGKGASRTMLDHPVLELTVAGRPVFLEPDLVAFQSEGIFHVVEIKSFAVVDGQAPGDKAAGAVLQGAAYIIALQDLLTRAGFSPERVSTTLLLITPRDFSRRPMASTIDARHQIKSLRRQLDRLERIEDLLGQLPAGITFDLAYDGPDARTRTATRDRDDLTKALNTTEARYRANCRHHCQLAHFCRAQAHEGQLIDVLGSSASEDLGGIDTIAAALGLADGSRAPAPDQEDLATALRHAESIRNELFGGAA